MTSWSGGGGALLPGQIHSNRRTLMALLRRDGFVAVDPGIAPDVDAEIERRLMDGVARCDLVLTSGGVSMGDFRLVKVVLDRIGKMSWMQVAIRPAKPFAFGLIGDTPVAWLPATRCRRWSVARCWPGLGCAAGPAGRTRISVGCRCHRFSTKGSCVGAGDRGCPPGCWWRAGPDGRYHVRSAGGQGSHQLYAKASPMGWWSPPGGRVAVGDTVDVLLL